MANEVDKTIGLISPYKYEIKCVIFQKSLEPLYHILSHRFVKSIA